MVMRVGGLATGMDIESIVNKLMDAERIPLVKLQQDKAMLEWKRDAFRDVNRAISELDSMMYDMKMSKTYNSKSVASSQENAVTATGATSASNGSYNINVERLATNEMHVGGKLGDDVDPNAALGEEGKFIFKTYDEKEQKMVEHVINVEANDTINSVMKKINNGDNNVRAFFDTQSKQVILETTRTGKYNEAGKEIEFEVDGFLTNRLKLNSGEGNKVIDAQNAEFTYNDGLKIESQNNSYTLNGINFQFHDVTTGNAKLTVTNDVDASFEKIVKFVDKYNEVIEKLNATQQEEKFRDFKPLTNEQKKDMSEDEIKKWEEKAKSGILRGESAISNSMYSLRNSWYSNVETDGAFSSLTQIGIKTTSNYMDGGKLQIDEDKLKEALRENPGDVQKLFSNTSKEADRGLVNRLEDAVKRTMGNIEKQAGKETHTLDNYTLGKRMKELNDRISVFEARMIKVEQRHWNQFTQMEKAIQRLNDQSSQLFSQFGG